MVPEPAGREPMLSERILAALPTTVTTRRGQRRSGRAQLGRARTG
ncbi:hypothetical protein [Actinoplanes sp. RD1]|nr:hypothetical protein [Actinoplanes sp. RD1]